jgi:hypothetical protein
VQNFSHFVRDRGILGCKLIFQNTIVTIHLVKAASAQSKLKYECYHNTSLVVRAVLMCILVNTPKQAILTAVPRVCLCGAPNKSIW